MTCPGRVRARGRSRCGLVLLCLVAVTLTAPPAPRAVAEQPPTDETAPEAVRLPSAATLAGRDRRRYVVALEPGEAVASALRRAESVPLRGPVIHGAVVRLTAAQAKSLAQRPGVRAVTPDHSIGVAAPATGPTPGAFGAIGGARGAASSWGLDRTDQVDLPLDGQFTPPSTGSGVHVWVVDSGIAQESPEFAGRIGVGAYTTGTGVADCHGHGTHVAGTIGSSRYGMARDVILHPVRTLDCQGRGSVSDILLALNWVASVAPPRSIINMSLSGPRDETLNGAIDALTSQGFLVVAAAGNKKQDACGASPGSAPSALTVGAADRQDRGANYSNFGPCVDLFAPGTDIRSTDHRGGDGRTMSGTSMAAPHVSGAAALFWSLHPEFSRGLVHASVLAQVTPDTLLLRTNQAGSPNRYLNVDWATRPHRVESLRASAGDGRAVVRWAPPAYSGNLPVLGYRVEMRQEDGPWSLIAEAETARGLTATGLVNGSAYRFRVAAVNDLGTGPFAVTADVTPRPARRGGTFAAGSCLDDGLAKRPQHLRLICVRDSHKGGSQLRWRTWGSRKAVATGKDSFSVACTGCRVVSWRARFELTRPRTVRGTRMYTRLKITAREPVPRKVRVGAVERYHTRWRFTEGSGPCLYQWVQARYARGTSCMTR